ncbi:MAG TPA: CmpA/NrtA family ABC transporter substrate-binding protein [Verrucomicrobiae bacterium]|jgi:ABC-type nitrate/sulfonate/bicarbonate transport system substrate-binding protein|nr:CmpA/NrtA family ABC transporter substrate-binding protein [Verrucomicrobiae bacterium]
MAIKTHRIGKKIRTAKPSPQKLRLGFVPLTDCAPLIMAHELGLFQKYGLNVELSRELGWATVRDKIIHGELEAAHAVGGMPFAATLGLGSIACECLTALVLNLHGNAITLSNDLWKKGVRDGNSLREEITRSRDKTFVFGAVYPFSSHNLLLREWLSNAGIQPGRDARIVIVPPPQMVANLKAGNLDGFCVGEPWNSVAVQSRVGWCVDTSAELAPGHPEKVLMVRRDFAEKNDAQHIALVAALLEACEFCDAPQNREQIVATLAQPGYVNVPETALRNAFSAQFDFGHGQVRHVPNFDVFHRHNANEPSADKAAWILQRLRASGLCANSLETNQALINRIFRTDIFDRAVQLRGSLEAKNKFETRLTDATAPGSRAGKYFPRALCAGKSEPEKN